MTTKPLTLYSVDLSGHCHRVRLLLSMLDIPFETVAVNLAAGEHKTPEFLARNAFGQVPVIDDNGTVVADSNAILVYLAQREGADAWLPTDPVKAAAVQRWLSVAAGPLNSGPGLARLINLFGAPGDAPAVVARSHALLAIMNAHLNRSAWLAGDAPTLADLACYAYVLLAPEGNVTLAPYPQVRAWLARVEALPKFVPMTRSPIGMSA